MAVEVIGCPFYFQPKANEIMPLAESISGIGLTIQAKAYMVRLQAFFPTCRSEKNFVGIRFNSAFHYHLACFRPSSDNIRIFKYIDFLLYRPDHLNLVLICFTGKKQHLHSASSNQNGIALKG
ncbi:MAG: hypothetical protein V2I56_03300 [Desulfobacteraceae bacterium]|jgi:hypothetical protein|nr:hypothetical protein [Desulfobacteraceae bacterium]